MIGKQGNPPSSSPGAIPSGKAQRYCQFVPARCAEQCNGAGLVKRLVRTEENQAAVSVFSGFLFFSLLFSFFLSFFSFGCRSWKQAPVRPIEDLSRVWSGESCERSVWAAEHSWLMFKCGAWLVLGNQGMSKVWRGRWGHSASELLMIHRFYQLVPRDRGPRLTVRGTEYVGVSRVPTPSSQPSEYKASTSQVRLVVEMHAFLSCNAFHNLVEMELKLKSSKVHDGKNVQLRETPELQFPLASRNEGCLSVGVCHSTGGEAFPGFFA